MEDKKLSNKISKEDIDLLKAYFGKRFFSDIEEYSDASPRVLKIVKEERINVRKFIIPFSVAYIVLTMTILLGIMQGDSVQNLIFSDELLLFILGLFLITVLTIAIFAIARFLISFFINLIKQGTLFEFMIIFKEDEEKAEDIRSFLRGKK